MAGKAKSVRVAEHRALAADLVTWRNGVHIAGTPIWCDVRHRAEVCFVSAPHALGGVRHGQLIGTPPTLAMLGSRAARADLAVPYGRPFTLGTLRLELIRSGHGPGGASLAVDAGGRRVLYAGAVCLQGTVLGGCADVRHCDAVVVSAPYGEPVYAFPPVAQVLGEVSAFVREVTGRGGVAVLLVTSASKALEVASRLHEQLPTERILLCAPRPIHDACQRLRPLMPNTPALRRYSPAAPPPGGHVLLWLAQRRSALPNLPAPSRIALVSGRAARPGALAEAQAQAGYVWSDQADFADLVRYIESCEAGAVYLTHCQGDGLVSALRRSNAGQARRLGPHTQMSLFAG